VAAAIDAGWLQGGVAVGSPNDTSLAWHFETGGLSWVVNPAADKGMASSLQVGLERLGEIAGGPAADAAMILLADQPLVRIEVIARLVQHWRTTGHSVRPRYAAHAETPGHPVLLARALWSLADSLEGDSGLGSALRRTPDAIDFIDVTGDNPDIDYPNDLSRLPRSS
jgi:CTP:molybdopterin cytidylyltransferase MocA